jgi:methionyl-tRNA formyltransferase
MLDITFWGTDRYTWRVMKHLCNRPEYKSIKGFKINKLITTDCGCLHPKLAELCNEENIPVSDNQETDTFFNLVCAYGNYIPTKIFNKPNVQFINIHPSLLPKYRGANPIIATVLNGEKEAGVTYHLMSKEIDKGDVLKKYSIDVGNDETALSLEKKLARLASKHLVSVLNNFENIEPKAQKGEPSYTYKKLTNFKNAEIDWTQDPKDIKWFIQGYFNKPIAWSYLDEQILKIFPGELIQVNEKDMEPGTLWFSKKHKAVLIATKTNLFYNPSTFQLECKCKVANSDFYNGYQRFNNFKLK